MASSVVRANRKKGFAVVLREVAQDSRLSLKARGLLLLMASLPESWEYTIAGLAKKAGTGKDQIRSGLQELLEVGYLVKEQSHGADGRFAQNIFILQDEPPPLSGNPTTDNPTTGFPLPENPTENNIEEKSIEEIPPISPAESIDIWEMFDRFWEAYPKKKGKEDARKAWAKLSPDLALCRVMSAALAEQKKSKDWTKDGGQYIPHPATWLNGKRWQDELEPAVPDPGAPEIPEGDERRGRYL